MFKTNWDMQEKIRVAQMQDEKEKLKQAMRGSEEKSKTQTQLFEKVKFDLLSSHDSSCASLTTQPKLDKQAQGYEQMLIKLENDVR